MKHTGKHSNRKSRGALAGYAFAALLAVQPFVNDEIDLNRKVDLARFIFRIGIAMMIAVLSRYLANNQSTIHETNNSELPRQGKL
jgi:hypothetical protein